MTNWINELTALGYKYIVALDSNLNEVYATKSNKIKNGEFRSNANFDVFSLGRDEHYPFTPNNIINIGD